MTYLVQEVHEDHLRVTLTTVTRARLLAWLATLHDDKVWNDVSSDFIQTREDLAHVVLFRALAKREEAEGLRIDVGVSTEDFKHDTGRGHVVARTDDHTVADDE